MKTLPKILLLSLLAVGSQLAWTSCVADVGGGGYYSPGGVWIQDDVWLDGGGRGWFGGHDGGHGGGGGYAHPGGGGHRR
jgi:hypothetical protein